MAGRSAMNSISGVMADINSAKAGGTSGVSGSENSMIGGMSHGENGGELPYKDVCNLKNRGLKPNQETGPGAGYGETL